MMISALMRRSSLRPFGSLVTLSYTRKAWKDHRWTYPDYRTEEVAQFAEMCRRRLREYLAETRDWRAQRGS